MRFSLLKAQPPERRPSANVIRRVPQRRWRYGSTREAVNVSGTYYAGIILKWLDEK